MVVPFPDGPPKRRRTMDFRTYSTGSRRHPTALPAALFLVLAFQPLGEGSRISQWTDLQAQSPLPLVPVGAALATRSPEPADHPVLRRLPLDLRVAPQGALYRVVLSDGRIYYGSVISGGDPVRIGLAPGGIREFARETLVRVEEVQGTLVDGEFWPRDPNHSRLVFAPTGRNLPRGTGSANAYYGVVPFLALGLTDRFTMAGGVTLVKSEGLDFFPSRNPVVPGDEDELPPGRSVHLAPKVQVLRGRRIEAAVGALVFMPTRDPGSLSGLGYAVGTLAIDDRTSVTLGVGLGLRHGTWREEATWMVGADRRVSRRIKVLSENYRFPGGETLHMGGVRLVGEQLSADLGVAFRPGAPERPMVPVLNISFGW
jgi:hypothetical protein